MFNVSPGACLGTTYICRNSWVRWPLTSSTSVMRFALTPVYSSSLLDSIHSPKGVSDLAHTSPRCPPLGLLARQLLPPTRTLDSCPWAIPHLALFTDSHYLGEPFSRELLVIFPKIQVVAGASLVVLAHLLISSGITLGSWSLSGACRSS
jgi:hypothetical protein